MAVNGKIIVVVVLLLFLSSIAGVVTWGALSNWWDLFESDESESSPSPSTTNTPSAPRAPAPTPRAPAPTPLAPSSVTINGQTFDPTGYSVSKGWFWNRIVFDANTTPTIETCRQKCNDNSDCTSFGRLETTLPGVNVFGVPAVVGVCGLGKFDNSGSENTHIRGIKNDGSNNYSKPISLNYYYDSAPLKVTMDLNECISNCTSNSSCVGWFYRTNDHSDVNLRRTCVLCDSSISPDKYRKGLINR